MRVVIITFVAGGAADHYTAQLANFLSRSNELYVLLPEHAEVQYFDKAVILVKLPIPKGLFKAVLNVSSPYFLKSVTRKIDEIKPHVIHLVFEHRFPFIYALILGRKYPMVITMHEPRAIPNRGALANTLVAPVQYMNNRLLAAYTRKVIIHSQKLANCRLISKLSVNRISVIPLGDFSFFAQSHRTTPPVKTNVLFFGRIAPYKGIEYLIEAGKLVRKQIPDLTITIAGAGDFTKYQKIIGTDSSFFVLNRYISDNQVAELFQKASIVVLPYTDGTQTGIISIAASFGKPIIATDVGNFSEVVEHSRTGLIVPPKNVKALADAMIKLLSDSNLRQNMGENARNMVREKFSWDNISKETVKTYEQAIESHKRNQTTGNRKAP